MRKAPLAAALAASLLFVARAAAHSSVPSPANFTSPPPLTPTKTDGGADAYPVYPFPIADASFEVTWDDGDLDPVGRHFFYYLDHAPPLALSLVDIEAMATPIPESAGGIWASCSCASDLAICPDAGVRDCRNAFTWDTHAVPDGTYFLVAVTRDPPYDVYTVSSGPVRIGHGTAPPPGVILVRPDGFGSFDTSYAVRWLLGGTAPFHVDLAYASDDDVRAGTPFAPLALDVALTAGSDGTYSYDWDVSALASARIYHVRASVRDASGQVASTISRGGVTVFHPGDTPDLASPRGDMSAGQPDHEGCGCTLGAAPRARGALLFLPLLLLARRRRSRA